MGAFPIWSASAWSDYRSRYSPTTLAVVAPVITGTHGSGVGFGLRVSVRLIRKAKSNLVVGFPVRANAALKQAKRDGISQEDLPISYVEVIGSCSLSCCQVFE